MKIGIAGIGGIGSNVALNLVRSGLDNFKLIDFDRVELSNLNRQFYFHDQIGRPKVEALAENLRRIRPELRLELVITRITGANCRQLFTDCDLVVEGLDDQADKKMLLEMLAGERTMVSACGIAGAELGSITRRQLGTCTVVGDFASDCRNAPLFAHKVLTVAGHMTEHILRLLSAKGSADHG